VKVADNALGYTHASGAFGRYAFTSQVVDSLFVGETENIGNPTTDTEKAYGRSLPKPTLPDFPIHGYEYYDYRHDVVNTTFRISRTTPLASRERSLTCCLAASGSAAITPSRR
jgi:cell migration-inducing and hyaluronan-binding protein